MGTKNTTAYGFEFNCYTFNCNDGRQTEQINLDFFFKFPDIPDFL